MDNKLCTWVIQELKNRGWSHRELARRSKVSHGYTSGILSGRRPVTFDFCMAIAEPLGKQPEDLFRLAGLLPPLPKENENLIKISETAQRMSPEKQKEFLAYGLWLLNRED